MDPIKTGRLIRQLRTAQGLTQRALAERLFITDKTVSKWETGGGCPDIALLRALADTFGVSMETLLRGEISEQEDHGDMKKTKLYICPDCGSILTSTSDAEVHCCGRRLDPLVPQKADEASLLQMEEDGAEWYITSDCPMSREDYIPFVAFLTDSTLLLSRQYPEWGLHVRMPYIARGRLLWYRTTQGLLYRDIYIRRK